MDNIKCFTNLMEFIDEFNSHVEFKNPDKSIEFFNFCELEMAKMFLKDSKDMAIRVSKIILALNDINDVKIKIE